MFVRLSVLDWESNWLYVLLKELSSWGMVVAICYIFQPRLDLMTVFDLTTRPALGSANGTDDEDLE